ncbi:DUF4248 domain-containing protein [Phocaeicola sp.]
MENIEEEIKIKSYSKADIAHLYNPTMCYVSAMRTLRRWINRNEKLVKALSDSGYIPSQHSFTPKQVELIFTYLGRP